MTEHPPVPATDFPPCVVDSIEDFEVTKRLEEGRSENTIKAYKHDLTMFFSFVVGACNPLGTTLSSLSDVKVAHVKRFLATLDERGYTRAGLARKIATLKSFFGHAIFMGTIHANPMDRIKSPRVSRTEHLPKFLTTDEMDQVLAFLRASRWIEEYIMVRFMYATMCRVSELCGARVRDVDFDGGTVRLRGKGNKERLVPVDDLTLLLIKKLVLPRREGVEQALFKNKRGGDLHPRVVQEMFASIKSMLRFAPEKKLTPHVMRHTGATLLRRNGMDISELQDLLGHASPNTTRIYAKNDIEAIAASYRKMHPLARR